MANPKAGRRKYRQEVPLIVIVHGLDRFRGAGIHRLIVAGGEALYMSWR
jgi:hypothetical protein